MTEAEWNVCDDPQKLLWFLEGTASDRKLRLFAVACHRRADECIAPEARTAFDVCEQYAEGRATSDLLLEAFQAIEYPADLYPADDFTEIGSRAFAVRLVVNAVARDYSFFGAEDEHEGFRIQSGFLRDIFASPFYSLLCNPLWLTPTVTGLAETIYAERAFDRLPILADALEDAGCSNADILNHCRQPSEHVRGCWVIDLLTGRQ